MQSSLIGDTVRVSLCGELRQTGSACRPRRSNFLGPPLETKCITRQRTRQARVSARGLAQLHSTKTSSTAFEIRVAKEHEYWSTADLQCGVFYPYSSGMGRELARFDKVAILHMNDAMAARSKGRAACVIACTKPMAASLPVRPPHAPPNFLLSFVSELLLTDAARRGYGIRAWEAGVIGTATMDTFGDAIPPRTLDAERDGAVGWLRRAGVFAYVGNVCVAASERRSGVALALMSEVERRARRWGCRAICLHCNPTNGPAWALYRRLGYRRVALEPPWNPLLNGRPGDRCWLLLKRLGARRAAEGHDGPGPVVKG